MPDLLPPPVYSPLSEESRDTVVKIDHAKMTYCANLAFKRLGGDASGGTVHSSLVTRLHSYRAGPPPIRIDLNFPLQGLTRTQEGRSRSGYAEVTWVLRESAWVWG